MPVVWPNSGAKPLVMTYFAHQHLRDGQQAQAGAVLLGVRVAVDLVVGVHLRPFALMRGTPNSLFS